MSDIVISNLNKAFGPKQVLRDFSAIFPEGKTTCLMGESGAGKTTLMNILLGLVAPDSGTITGLEGRFSVVFQEDRLTLTRNAIAAIRFANPALPRQTVSEELAALGLTGSAQTQPVGELSGGMRRRVAILRALLAPFDVLLLDEPFQGLDEDNRSLVASQIRAHTQRKTVILVTHDEAEAALFDSEIIHL
jgi:NitT/TauT family transport system ATP-binding protein